VWPPPPPRGGLLQLSERSSSHPLPCCITGGEMATTTSVLRRSVPNDNSCLFYALAYLCEGVNASPAVESRLRSLVADAVLADPDPETRALFLGKPVEEYARWIKNTFHWGGENEIVILAQHYGVEVAVVSCETLSVLVYGQEEATPRPRVYILYTGQHYDPLVGGSTADIPVEDETRQFAPGAAADVLGARDAAALEVARAHNLAAAKRAAQKRVTRIKCGGCGALLEDSAAFQAHCGEVEHDDDFCYDCEEVEVVIEAGEALPEGSIDLTDEDSFATFYANNCSSPLSLHWAGAIDLPETRPAGPYTTAEHAWHAARFLKSAPVRHFVLKLEFTLGAFVCVCPSAVMLLYLVTSSTINVCPCRSWRKKSHRRLPWTRCCGCRSHRATKGKKQTGKR
jgi:hypothetical protein